MPGHADFTRIQFLLAVTKDHARILPDGKAAQNRLHARKHALGIRTEEEEARLFIALREAVETVVAGGGAQLADDGVEVEVGVNLIRQARAIEQDRQALVLAELPQDLLI